MIAHENLGKISPRLRAVLGNPRVLHFVVIYFLIQASVYGVIFYLPTQVAALLGMHVGLRVGMVTTIPWICAMADFLDFPGHLSGRHSSSQWHCLDQCSW